MEGGGGVGEEAIICDQKTTISSNGELVRFVI